MACSGSSTKTSLGPWRPMATAWPCVMVSATCQSSEPITSIIPRKGIIELSRLLDENEVKVAMGSNHIRVTGGDYCFHL